jgi:hypothetical protein
LLGVARAKPMHPFVAGSTRARLLANRRLKLTGALAGR